MNDKIDPVAWNRFDGDKFVGTVHKLPSRAYDRNKRFEPLYDQFTINTYRDLCGELLTALKNTCALVDKMGPKSRAQADSVITKAEAVMGENSNANDK